MNGLKQLLSWHVSDTDLPKGTLLEAFKYIADSEWMYHDDAGLIQGTPTVEFAGYTITAMLQIDTSEVGENEEIYSGMPFLHIAGPNPEIAYHIDEDHATGPNTIEVGDLGADQDVYSNEYLAHRITEVLKQLSQGQ